MKDLYQDRRARDITYISKARVNQEDDHDKVYRAVSYLAPTYLKILSLGIEGTLTGNTSPLNIGLVGCLSTLMNILVCHLRKIITTWRVDNYRRRRYRSRCEGLGAGVGPGT